MYQGIKGALNKKSICAVFEFHFQLTFCFVSVLCQAKDFMVFVHHLLPAKTEWAFVYNFSDATLVDNLLDSPLFL